MDHSVEHVDQEDADRQQGPCVTRFQVVMKTLQALGARPSVLLVVDTLSVMGVP